MSKEHKVFVARQGIFNRKHTVVGYELLYRESLENFFPSDMDSHIATSRVISNSHFHLGLDHIAGDKPALINLSEKCILRGIAHLLPADKVILEVLENVTPSEQVLVALRVLFHKGYRIALDDFVLKPEWIPFLNVVKLIKVDVQATPDSELVNIVEQLRCRPNIRLLAEKIETVEEFERCVELDFKFFQGYYFSHPEVKSMKSSDPLQHVLLMVVNEVMRDDIRLSRVDKLFAQDARLIFKLLRYLNSGQFPIQVEINSISSALRYLGNVQLRRFVTLIVTSLIGEDQAEHLVKQSVLFARFCELITKPTSIDSEQAFLVGLLSVLHKILGITNTQLVATIAIDNAIAEGLLPFKTSFSDEGKQLNHLLQLVSLYDQGKWYQSQRMANVLSISADTLPDYYRQAVTWTEDFVQHNVNSSIQEAKENANNL